MSTSTSTAESKQTELVETKGSGTNPATDDKVNEKAVVRSTGQTDLSLQATREIGMRISKQLMARDARGDVNSGNFLHALACGLLSSLDPSKQYGLPKPTLVTASDNEWDDGEDDEDDAKAVKKPTEDLKQPKLDRQTALGAANEELIKRLDAIQKELTAAQSDNVRLLHENVELVRELKKKQEDYASAVKEYKYVCTSNRDLRCALENALNRGRSYSVPSCGRRIYAADPYLDLICELDSTGIVTIDY